MHTQHRRRTPLQISSARCAVPWARKLDTPDHTHHCYQPQHAGTTVPLASVARRARVHGCIGVNAADDVADVLEACLLRHQEVRHLHRVGGLSKHQLEQAHQLRKHLKPKQAER